MYHPIAANCRVHGEDSEYKSHLEQLYLTCEVRTMRYFTGNRVQDVAARAADASREVGSIGCLMA